MKKKLLGLVLAVACVFGLVACKKDETTTVKKADVISVDTPDYVEGLIYDSVLADFNKYYSYAKEEASNVSERFAYMAVAEAKLLEAGVLLPMQADGGNYAISKVVPYSIDYALWGNDQYRYHNALVANKALTVEDRNECKALWAQYKGTGNYQTQAKAYLETKEYTFKNSYSLVYTGDPETYDAFMTSNATDSEVLVNTYDGLMEYDCEGVLQPALATAVPEAVAIQGDDEWVTYTFTIRNNVKWVKKDGTEYADVKADDWCAGFQHMLDDPEGGLEWLVEGVIKGVTEYVAGKDKDFSKVGVKALDDHTLQYTVAADCSYFKTMFGYSVFAPLCRTFYVAEGGKFGTEYANGGAGTYGTDADHILYNGAYIISEATKESKFKFVKNTSYWNAANISIDEITWVYADGTVATQSYDFFTAGTIDGCGLNNAAVIKAVTDGHKKTDEGADIYVSGTGASSYPSFFNVYRRGYANANDDTALVSKLTQSQAEDTNLAMQNQNFRLALAFAFDRCAYMAASVGDEVKAVSMVNSYTPGNFVSLEEAVTITVDGVTRNYPANTFYGQIMQDQLNADQYPITVWDTAKSGDAAAGHSGYDGWYNPTNAATYLAKAIAELEEAYGLKVTAENPIYVEYPYQEDGDTKTAVANAVKKSIEYALGGKVKVILNGTNVRKELLYAAYYPAKGAQMNYNFSSLSGWGPDYGDPSSYLDTMAAGGYMVKCIGLDW